MSKTRKRLFNEYKSATDSIKYSIEQKCDVVLQKNQSNRQPDGKIHPSMIGNCPRYIYFFMNNIPYTNYLPHPPKLQRIFDVGKDHETRMKKNMKMANILVDVDTPIPENKDKVDGTNDAIVLIDSKYFICEIKSANDYSYSSCIPHKNYQYQTSTYMIYLQIDDGKIYYGNKNDSEQTEVDININDPIVQETKQLINFYNQNYDTRTIPDVQNIKPNCNATSCWYFNQCNNLPMVACKDS